jgi:DNA-binding transcriptional regulator YhcF (GntR family)
MMAVDRVIKNNTLEICKQVLPNGVLFNKNTLFQTTVFPAYVELEKRGIVESRHRSGYFIKARLKRLRNLPEIKYHEMVPKKVSLDDLIHQLTEDMSNPHILKLGSVAVAPDHLPFKRLHQGLNRDREAQPCQKRSGL